MKHIKDVNKNLLINIALLSSSKSQLKELLDNNIISDNEFKELIKEMNNVI